MELVESMPLLEWFANNYKNFGATLEIITDKSQEGAQFVKGFGGIGGKNSSHSHRDGNYRLSACPGQAKIELDK